MTEQEAFDRVWQWFVVEKHPPAFKEGQGGCSYLTPEGCRCAVGCLLTDEILAAIIAGGDNGRAIDELIEHYPSVDSYLGNLGVDFLADLQDCHDRFDCEVTHEEFTEEIRHALRLFANQKDLLVEGTS